MSRALADHVPIHTAEPVYPLTVGQYHEMIRHGVLTDDDPVELLEGVLVFHMPKNPPHRFVTRAAFDAISAMLPADWHCQMQEPVTLTDGEPEPDLAVVRGRPADYRDRHPSGAADVALVIEVADSTLERDRGVKLRSYARAGIGEYWIVNLVERRIEVYRRDEAAQPPRYLSPMVYEAGQSVPLVIDGRSLGGLAVAAVLP